ncbi:MAG: hypothetical protein V4772_05155 [Pseudomonadota bacterium]
MNYKILSCSAMLVLIAGCAELKTPYQIPPSNASAEIEMFTNGSYVQYYENGKNCTDGKYFSSADYFRTNTLFVPAEKRVAVAMTEIGPTAECNIILSFIPKRDKRYRLTYHSYRASQSGTCRSNLVELSNGRSVPLVDEDVILMTWDFSFANTCSPKRKSMPPPTYIN